MPRRIMTVLGALSIAFASTPAIASDPTGRWRTIDDQTGQAKSIVEIRRDAEGVYSGRIVELLNPSRPDPVCDKCKDDRRNQPITGMEIIRGMRTDGEGFGGGTILKPDEGKVYRSKMRLLEEGRKLEVSGCVAFICKSQVWQRP
jgi:uncharacterized protein (DUF2147 family)